MAQRDNERDLGASVEVDPNSDPHELLFGDDYPPERPLPGGHRSRADAAAIRQRRRRGRRALWILSVVGLVVVAVAALLIVPKVASVLNPPDYAGSGSGVVRVSVKQGDTAADIAATLRKAGVIKGEKAFVNAAADNSASQGIQPGTYVLRSHMSAKAALSLLLDPSSRSSTGDVLVTEGATSFDVTDRLAKVLGADKRAAITAAMGKVKALGIPLGYAADSGPVTSIEGFLYPATYSIDPASTPTAALQKMVSRYADADRSSHFAAGAKKLGITPYQALIIASIAQSEAKYPADMAKVARVILNHLAADVPLKIDATSVYGAKVKGLDPAKVIYAEIDSPYNSYTHDGLPPTPISNPGADAMAAAVHPAKGDWMFYVNGDAAGHLFFTNDEHAFVQAAAKCRDHNWGCG